MEMQILTEEMNKLSELIENINSGEIEITEDDLVSIEFKRENLLKIYFKNFMPQNVVPLL